MCTKLQGLCDNFESFHTIESMFTLVRHWVWKSQIRLNRVDTLQCLGIMRKTLIYFYGVRNLTHKTILLYSHNLLRSLVRVGIMWVCVSTAAVKMFFVTLANVYGMRSFMCAPNKYRSVCYLRRWFGLVSKNLRFDRLRKQSRLSTDNMIFDRSSILAQLSD